MRGTKLKRYTVLLLATAALACVGSGESSQEQKQQPSDWFRDIAAKARAKGETAVTVSILIERFPQDDSGILNSFSVFLVRPRALNAATTFVGDYMSTWHTMEVVRELDLRPISHLGGCDIKLPPGVRLAQDEIAVALNGGTTVVDGVSITEVSRSDPALVLAAHKRYLFVGLKCESGLAIMPYGAADFVEVSDDGNLLPAYPNAGRLPHIQKLLALGTLANGEKYLPTLRATPVVIY